MEAEFMIDYTADNNLTIIPARGGSKRVPGKNIKLLAGKPLLAWSIDCARSVNMLGDIVVSTDDPAIASVARACGIEVPELRSPELSSDTAATKDLVIDCVNRYEEKTGKIIEWITLLQPTSPFRSKDSLEKGVRLFKQNHGQTVVAVAKQRVPLNWMLTLDRDDNILDRDIGDVQGLHYYCGSLYVLDRRTLQTTGDLYSPEVKGLRINCPIEALDIDTPEDWKLAECLARGLIA